MYGDRFWFIQIYEKNLASHRYILGKRRSILMVFSDNCRYDSLLLQRKLTTVSSFLKVGCSMEPENVSMNFSNTITLISIGLSSILNGSLTNAWFFTPWTSLKRSQEYQTTLWNLLENSLECSLKMKDIVKLWSSYTRPSLILYNL